MPVGLPVVKTCTDVLVGEALLMSFVNWETARRRNNFKKNTANIICRVSRI